MVEAITAEIPYTLPTEEKLVNESFGPKNIHGRRTGTVELKPMTVRNGRLIAESLSLDEQGLVFVKQETKVVNFFDEEQVKLIYYPEIEALIRRLSGASRVVIFDHALRSADEAEREEKLIRNPVLQAHNDYTAWSGPNRLREILPDEADELLKHRFAIIQVWRAIHRPIEANPLALADARSVEFDDWMVAERRYPHRVGQTYRLKYNPKHQWIYFPKMRPDEAIVFKVYDSEEDGRARFTAHTSFEDPSTRPDAPPRQSIEMRAFAFFRG
ncbi:MAG TPA: CmcJ/NvfI family oxidoreductase [Candidatus Binatia bacterium]|nr:CmcJ/NvfI family oxidoreductase [Candidatus Binatia bacterium]